MRGQATWPDRDPRGPCQICQRTGLQRQTPSSGTADSRKDKYRPSGHSSSRAILRMMTSTLELKSLQMVTAAMKLKETCSLEEKL